MSKPPTTLLATRCATLLSSLDHELDWRLSDNEQKSYITAILPFFSEDASDTRLRQTLIAYHEDHALVESLRAREHTQSEANWSAWSKQVIAILHHAGLLWSSDFAVDAEDLAQIAQMELIRSLASFRYSSRFSTWAYQVIVRSVQRHLRNAKAQKRAARPESLDQLPADIDIEQANDENPTTLAEVHTLAAQIEAILTDYAGQRLARIFQLWASADLSAEEIGRRVKLSPSRVRTLLAQAREHLRQHPQIRAWLEDGEGRADCQAEA
ncbi:MAG: sigma-70 family RNA polymerase sigma factor [Chloroflexales bacterium]|nr:sigma-70 family RNA polymerase sigma factor [Chloroflexales bacterium]